MKKAGEHYYSYLIFFLKKEKIEGRGKRLEGCV